MKKTHDEFIKKKRFENGQWILLYQNRFRFTSGKLSTKWVGPYIIHVQHPNGAVEIGYMEKGKVFKVNGNRMKLYYEHDPKYREWNLDQDDPSER